MRIESLAIRNYRTLESIDLTFPSSYTAICGANDSGKTNVVRAIRALMSEEDVDDFEGIDVKKDFPKWSDAKTSKREIGFAIRVALDRRRDEGFYQFVVKQLSLKDDQDPLEVLIKVSYTSDGSPGVIVEVGGVPYSDFNAQEILAKLQSSRSILFHNSTQLEPSWRLRRGGYIREIAGQHEATISEMEKTLARGLAKISKSQQLEFENLLGRLQTKYKVGLSLPTVNVRYLPFTINLGDHKFKVPLEDWGSGTKNRTMILLMLFRARQSGESEASASKVTPVIVVEEPESFLHPSAQAELGRVLHDLAEEFQVQVVVTTHSPYFLSMQEQASNILLRRRTAYKQPRDTERVNTAGEDWMAPFVQALGIDTEEFKPWRTLMQSKSDAVLLVEGDIDKEYFRMLQDPAHGANRLSVPGEIVPYEGYGALTNTVLLRFVRNRCRRLFVTFDLDAEGLLGRTFQALQMEKWKDYIPVGIDAPGKRNIEGLLPDSVINTVYGSSASLVQALTAGNKQEQESARGRLKRLLLDEFRRASAPGPEFYGKFYPFVKAINKAFA